MCGRVEVVGGGGASRRLAVGLSLRKNGRPELRERPTKMAGGELVLIYWCEKFSGGLRHTCLTRFELASPLIALFSDQGGLASVLEARYRANHVRRWAVAPSETVAPRTGPDDNASRSIRAPEV